MSFDTYAALQVEVADWLNKTNLTTRIPSFIALAEAKMRREITSIGHVDNYADVEIDENGFQLPCSADEVASVTHQGVSLPFVHPGRIGEIVAGWPRIYSIDGKVLKTNPTGTVTIRLAKTICPLSTAVRCNWVLKEHPDAYLYGALMQAAPYLRDDDRIGTWGPMFEAAIDSINKREVRRATGGDVRMRAGPTP